VKDTAHEPPESVQTGEPKVPEELEKDTVPDRAGEIPPFESRTFAVQLLLDMTGTTEGEQETLVVVGRFDIVIAVLPELPLWLESPP
jgi:hypothetical protein